jgi:hypothetical protein
MEGNHNKKKEEEEITKKWLLSALIGKRTQHSAHSLTLHIFKGSSSGETRLAFYSEQSQSCSLV